MHLLSVLQPHLDQTLAKLTARVLPWAALLHCVNAVWQFGTPGLLAQEPLSTTTTDLARAVLAPRLAARVEVGGSVALALMAALLAWVMVFRSTVLALLAPLWRGVRSIARAHCSGCARSGGPLAWLLAERRVQSDGIAAYTAVFRQSVETTTKPPAKTAAEKAATDKKVAPAPEKKGEGEDEETTDERGSDDGTVTPPAVVVAERPLHPLTRKQRQAGWVQKFDAVSEEWILMRQFVRPGKAHGIAHMKDQPMRTWEAMMGLSTYRILANEHYALALKGSIFEVGMSSASAVEGYGKPKENGGGEGEEKEEEECGDRDAELLDEDGNAIADSTLLAAEAEQKKTKKKKTNNKMEQMLVDDSGTMGLSSIDDMDYEQLERELAALERSNEGGNVGNSAGTKKKTKKKRKVLPADE